MDECPHGGYPLTCPPCLRGSHVVPRSAKRLTVPIGRRTKMGASQMCRADESDLHLLKRGAVGVWDGVKWVCEECAEHG